MKRILILNGSPSGARGNSQILIGRIRKRLRHESEVIQLAARPSPKALFKKLAKAEGFIFVTGTYWDSWGSPLQKFLESATPYEGSTVFLGKPSAVFVLEHSVGGKGVLSRLQGVLSTFGCLITPMGGLVYSLVGHLALQGPDSKHKDDFWSLGDVENVLRNFELGLEIRQAWQPWPVDGLNFRRRWLNSEKKR